VAEDDVFETLEEIGGELVLETVFAGELVAEDDVALEQAAAALADGQPGLVLDGLADVVQEDAGEGEVGMDLRYSGRSARAAGPCAWCVKQTVR
jgi:hypothetical protein